MAYNMALVNCKKKMENQKLIFGKMDRESKKSIMNNRISTEII
jgi:hypothetical protein